MIDQSTGLPLIDPSGIIQQIPLGLPIVPFADLNALGRPTRAPIYPDDFIPTVGMVVGQDKKGAARAGTMTDDRALRVSIANTSPLSVAPSISFNTGGFNSTSDPFTIAPGEFDKPSLVWAFLFWVQLLDVTTTAHTSIGFTFALQSNPSETRFGFATGVLNIRNPSESNDNLAYVSNIWLPNPLDMTSAFPESDTSAQVGIATLAGLNCACSIVYQ